MRLEYKVTINEGSMTFIYHNISHVAMNMANNSLILYSEFFVSAMPYDLDDIEGIHIEEETTHAKSMVERK
jgi:hypothetical protein